MLKKLLLASFLFISIISYGNVRDSSLTKDSVIYTADYIYFTKVVNMKIYDMKGSLVVEKKTNRYDTNFLKRGLYILSYDDRRRLYLKH